MADNPAQTDSPEAIEGDGEVEPLASDVAAPTLDLNWSEEAGAPKLAIKEFEDVSLDGAAPDQHSPGQAGLQNGETGPGLQNGDAGSGPAESSTPQGGSPTSKLPNGLPVPIPASPGDNSTIPGDDAQADIQQVIPPDVDATHLPQLPTSAKKILLSESSDDEVTELDVVELSDDEFDAEGEERSDAPSVSGPLSSLKLESEDDSVFPSAAREPEENRAAADAPAPSASPQQNGRSSPAASRGALESSSAEEDAAAAPAAAESSPFRGQLKVEPATMEASDAGLSPSRAMARGQPDEDEDARVTRELAEMEAEVERMASLGEPLFEDGDPEGRGAGEDGEMSDLDVSVDIAAAEAVLAEADRMISQPSDDEDAEVAAATTGPGLTEAVPFSPGPGAAPHRMRDGMDPDEIDPLEPPEFRGMLFYEGVDSLGRPVVVVNAEVVGHAGQASRKTAMAYMLQRLEPIVQQGPYVLVMVASLSTTHASTPEPRLPAMFLVTAFRRLSRPFRKNVKLIVMVRPSAALKAMLTLLRPFMSPKAARKLKRVDSLEAMEDATGQEVLLPHLGPRFLRTLQRAQQAELDVDRSYAKTHIAFRSGGF